MADRNIRTHLIERQIDTLNIAKPFVFVPDQNWDGNDGSWSTFLIHVGTPPQYFRVVPSINGQETWIPLPIDCQRGKSWCGNARGVEPFRNPSTAVALSSLDAGLTCSSNKSPIPGAANPAAATGFQFNQSSSWSVIGNYTLEGSTQLPDDAYGLFGTDVVAAGPNPEAALTPTRGSTVAGVAAQPIYLGLLGLRPSNSPRFDASSPSFLTNLRNQNLIPSLSFGYTAGAAYKSQGVLGSLTLGGYDRAKFTNNTVNFEINQDDSFALESKVQSIAASDTLVGDVELLSDNITAKIDSDLPYLYLPNAACKNFETAFGLLWDASKELYLVNDTNHGKLRSLNPTILFSFGQSKATAVNITISHQAFDLQVTQPIAENGTNYFPLRCSSDPSKYVLGRAFLQETYLLVDYELSNFALSQAQFSNGSDIVTVDHASAHQPSESDAESPGSSGLSRGAIAGIAISAFLALALLLSFFYLFRRNRRRRQADIRTRGFISAQHPFGSTKDSLFDRSTSSGDQNSNPAVTDISNESPIQRLEERLVRLERGNTVTELAGHTTAELSDSRTPELPENSTLQKTGFRGDTAPHWTSSTPSHTSGGPRQELMGSPTAGEMQETRRSGLNQLKPANWVSELAADNPRRTRRK
ncbi:MAG: hypothetical protein LQ349_006483 [Xanthoria aureola]|nr:MAG: hypothetical protein LQ349_006483 [Xanthoria aureola]